MGAQRRESGAEKVLVNNIQGYSLHDGPGIRTTVFLKGCNLRCRWCQNPEGLSPARQTGFIENLCQRCGRCMKACPEGAIVADFGAHRIDYSKCTACGACVEACYYGALVAYGKPMTAEEVYLEARKDAIFYEATGGGVTISGGEPLLHAGFVAEVLRMLNEEGIGTAIETAGSVPWSAFEVVIPYTDLFLFDTKLADSAAHKRWTGADNVRIHENAAKLVASGCDVLFRMPLLRGVSDSPENISATSEFLAGIGRPRLQLMPYHRMGENKYRALDMAYAAEDVPVMTADEVEEIRMAFELCGIECDVSR